jgi:acyl-CoA synthetase (AMP-forming)/AMP-acid ligase II/carbon monoxide dehydrogenase subunit G
MRLEAKDKVSAPPERIWELIDDPSDYPGLLAGIVSFEPQDPEREPGVGARYRSLMRVGSADVGGLVEVVEFDPPSDLAWTSITGIDQRGRLRLRSAGNGGTAVAMRLSYGSPGGVLGTMADYLAAPRMRENLRQSVENLKREAEGGEPSASGVPSILGRAVHELGNLRILAEAGVVRPLRPDKLARVGLALAGWRFTPAGATIANAVRYGEEPMVIDELGELSFVEVERRTGALANALAEEGVGEGDSVGIMCRNHRGFVDALTAVSKLGADALLLNTSFSAPQLAEVCEREEPASLIYDEEFSELLAEAAGRRKRFVSWRDSDGGDQRTLEELIDEAEASDPSPPSREGRATILTSGTTGTPKGAQRAQLRSLDPAASLLSRIPLRQRMTVYVVAPLFHAWGFAHYSLGLLLGSTYVLRRKFDPEQCLADVQRHRCEAMAVVPVMMQRILELPEVVRSKYDTSSLSVVAASGSALPGKLAESWMDEFGDNLYNLYGSTEVAWATIATPRDLRAAPGTAGKPPRGTVVKLFDADGHEVRQGETGRIFVGNEMLFEGYTGGGSKDRIGGLMATGDLGRFDEAGRLFVEGRDDEMIVSGGENVFPQEVEDTLARHDAVEEAAAVGVEDEEFGQRLRAFVVSKKGVSEEELKQHVKANLARYKVPREIVFVEELPRNPSGKVLKRELVKEDEEED